MTKEEAILVLDNARPQTKEIDRQFYDDEDLNNALDIAIKALEQQPSDDCVSRKEVLKLFQALKDDGGIFAQDYVENAINNNLSCLPPVTPTQRWIPVSERLPEDGQDVLAYYEYFRYGDYNRMWPAYGVGFQYDGHWGGDVSGHKLNVMAWMPLPEPYKEKRGNDNEEK